MKEFWKTGQIGISIKGGKGSNFIYLNGGLPMARPHRYLQVLKNGN